MNMQKSKPLSGDPFSIILQKCEVINLDDVVSNSLIKAESKGPIAKLTIKPNACVRVESIVQQI